MRAQVFLASPQAQLGANIVPMKQDGVLGKVEQCGDFFVCFTLFDQVGHPDFRGGEVDIV